MSRKDNGLHIEGFPGAVKFIKLDIPGARRIADLGLHKADLEFASECLASINDCPSEPSTLRKALWSSAIVHYAKCFGGSKARFQLDFSAVYKGEPPEAKLVFDYFKDLRNKHVVHDENSFAQSISGAVLNAQDNPDKIAKIICFSAIAQTLVQGNYSNLKLLVDKALAWVVAEFDRCCERATSELEKLSYEELLAKESVQYTAPSADEVASSRERQP